MLCFLQIPFIKFFPAIIHCLESTQGVADCINRDTCQSRYLTPWEPSYASTNRICGSFTKGFWRQGQRMDADVLVVLSLATKLPSLWKHRAYVSKSGKEAGCSFQPKAQQHQTPEWKTLQCMLVLASSCLAGAHWSRNPCSHWVLPKLQQLQSEHCVKVLSSKPFVSKQWLTRWCSENTDPEETCDVLGHLRST